MRFISLLLVVVAGIQLGCETRVSLGNPCRSDSECAGGLRCNFGRCRTECVDSSECPSGRFCLTLSSTAGACTLPTDTCRSGACEPGLMCEGELCVAPCATETCLAGTTCQSPRGVDVCLPPTLTSDAGMDAAMSTVDAGSDAQQTDAACAMSAPSTHGRICVGNRYACVVQGGTVRCWGNNTAGQLGDGTDATTRSTHDACGAGIDCALAPVTVRYANLPLTNVEQIACGDTHACARTRTGEVVCWGEAELLGNGGVSGAQAVRAILSSASELASGRDHTCARVGSEWQCWGRNSYAGAIDGRLGSRNQVIEVRPTTAPDFATFTRLELGGYYTCGINGGDVTCQGASVAGVCGEEYSPMRRAGPVLVYPGALDMPMPIRDAASIDLHTGDAHACALDDAGIISCWGADQYQVLASTFDKHTGCADASETCRNYAAPIEVGVTPVPVFIGLSRGFAPLTCAIDSAHHVYCWGDNTNGQAGYDDTVMRVGRVDAAVSTSSGLLSNVIEVAVGYQNACALTCDGSVYCWGANDLGQLGQGAFDALKHPRAMRVENL